MIDECIGGRGHGIIDVGMQALNGLHCQKDYTKFAQKKDLRNKKSKELTGSSIILSTEAQRSRSQAQGQVPCCVAKDRYTLYTKTA